MQEHIQTRLETLRQEFEAGRVELHALEMRQAALRETMLRIDGAVQVLEELLTTVDQSAVVPDGKTGPSDTETPRESR